MHTDRAPTRIPKIVDDRGCAYAIQVRVEDAALTKSRAAAIKQVVEILKNRESPAHKWVVGVAVVCAIGCMIAGMAMTWPMWGIFAGIFATGVAAQVVSARLATGMQSADVRRIRSLLLGEGLCPSCGEELLDVLEAEDGCDECPRCEAAWFVSEIGSRLSGEDSIQPITQWKAKAIIEAPKSIWRAESKLWAKDAHGDSAALLRITPKDRIRTVTSDDFQTRLREGWRRVRRLGRVRRVIVVVALSPFLLFICTMLVVATSIHAASWITAAGLGCFLIYRMTMIVRGYWFTNAARARDAMLESSLCPTCAEDLVGAAVFRNGITECPACAAAWRVPVKDVVPYAAASVGDAGKG